MRTGGSLRAVFYNCTDLFNFGVMPKRLKGPRSPSPDQNEARRVLEEWLIVHFLSPSQPRAGNLTYISEEKYVLVW